MPEPTWVKTRRCESNACVEVAQVGTTVVVRNSTDPDGPRLSFSRREWEAFCGGVLDGDFSFNWDAA